MHKGDGKFMALAFVALLPAFAHAQTASDEAQQTANTVHVSTPSYNSTNQTFTMPDGSTMKMSEMSSDYSQSSVNQMETVNPTNSAQAARNAEANTQNSNSVSAQAYRTGLAATAASQQYVDSPSQQVAVTADTEDPVNNDPGVVSFAPADYFISNTRGVVVVQVTLTGGAGPAVVAYETNGGNMSEAFYTPVRGELRWASGQTGTQTFTVPVNVATIMNDHITGGTINIQLYSARGAKLDTNVSGRIMIGNGQFSAGP